MSDKEIEIYVCRNVEGKSLVINNRLIAGPGVGAGAQIICRWKVSAADLRKDLALAVRAGSKGGGK